MTWPTNENPFGENRTPALFGLSYEDAKTRVPVAVDQATGAVIVNNIGSSGSAVTTVFQGGAPWLVNASVIGQIPVSATVPTLVIGQMPAISVTATNTTVFQGGAPWLVNASVAPLTFDSASNLLVNVATSATLVIGAMPPISVTATNTTVFQGGAPWSITGTVTTSNTIQSTITVWQGGAPWLVTGSVGATQQGAWNVTTTVGGGSQNATVFQGTSPWTINGTVTDIQGTNPWVISGTVTDVQGTNPWLVNASVVGVLNVNATTSAPFPVTATLGQQAVTATVSAPLPVTATIGIVNVIDVPTTSGGLSVFQGNLIATVVTLKASAGQIYGYHIFNVTATQAYVNFYNAAVATVGLTSPFMQLGIPSQGGATFDSDIGIAFSTDILLSATVSIGGAAAPATGVNVNIYYQ